MSVQPHSASRNFLVIDGEDLEELKAVTEIHPTTKQYVIQKNKYDQLRKELRMKEIAINIGADTTYDMPYYIAELKKAGLMPANQYEPNPIELVNEIIRKRQANRNESQVVNEHGQTYIEYLKDPITERKPISIKQRLMNLQQMSQRGSRETSRLLEMNTLLTEVCNELLDRVVALEHNQENSFVFYEEVEETEDVD